MEKIDFFRILELLISSGIAAVAAYIAFKQNRINDRLRSLQDYIAIAAVPGDRVIKIMNVGKANVYLWGFDMPGHALPVRYGKPRLVCAGTGDSAYYWIDPPAVPVGVFDFKLYLTDEFGEKWISEHGGEFLALPDPGMVALKVWSYKIEKSHWTSDVPVKDRGGIPYLGKHALIILALILGLGGAVAGTYSIDKLPGCFGGATTCGGRVYDFAYITHPDLVKWGIGLVGASFFAQLLAEILEIIHVRASARS